MKTLLLLLILGNCYNIIAEDSLKVKRTFPEIKTIVIQDTAYDISGTITDTFGFKPDFIFIARDFKGRLLDSRSYSPSLRRDGNLHLNHGYGYGRDTSYAVQLDDNYTGNYVVRFIDRHLRVIPDTIDFKTIIKVDSLVNKTYIYEIQLGMDSYVSECLIYSPKKIRDADQRLIMKSYENEDIYGVLESERLGRTKFYYDVIDQLQLSEKKKEKMYCICNTRPNKK